MSDGNPPLVVRKVPPPAAPATPPAGSAASPPGAPARPTAAAALRRIRPTSTSAKELLFRIVVVVLLLGSLALVWYTYNQILVPRQQKNRDLNTSLVRLSREVDDMERKWGAPEIQQLNTNLTLVDQQLIKEQPELETWVSQLRQQLVPLALDGQAEFGKSALLTNAATRNLALIPTTLSIQAQPAPHIEGVESPYQRLLRLTNRLLARDVRSDLTQISISSAPNAATRAEITLNLWAGEEAKP